VLITQGPSLEAAITRSHAAIAVVNIAFLDDVWFSEANALRGC
jgi:hypothetical protein